MNTRTLVLVLAMLAASCAWAQSYDMIIHLTDGQTVTIAHADILRIEFPQVISAAEDAFGSDLPLGFRLIGAFPNPFNPRTTIAYEVPASGRVKVTIHDLRGAVVKELVNETQTAGRHDVVWNGTDNNFSRVASGVYISAVTSGGRTLSQQLVLIK